MGFIDIEQQASFQPAPGVTMRTPHGKNLMLSLVEMTEGAEVPLHEHPHEQAGVVLSGKMELTIGEETRELGPGDMYIIPGGTTHRAIAVGGDLRVMDVFSPIREDYVGRQS